MSTHAGDNILFELMYGANRFGITLATPTDMMHACESGLIKYINKVFVSSMPLSVQVEVDKLIEKLFVGNQQAGKNRFSRTNFDGGACSLTMLSSHHWPGMTTAFLVMLLTTEGKLACKDCFAFKDGDDAPDPDYDWDRAPSLNIRKAYKPPIIKEEELYAALDSEIDSDDGSDMSTDYDADCDDEWMYDTDDDDDDNFIIDGGKKVIVPKKTTPLQCSYRQFVDLLQEVLSFHAWYRYGDPPFDHDPDQEWIDEIQLRIRQMIARIITYCPRESGYGWNIQKLHDHLHLVIYLLFFHHAMNWDAGRGERLLKPFFKDTAVTCQQRNTDVFVTQLAARAQEKLVLAKALLSRSRKASYEAIIKSRKELQEEQIRPVSYTFPVRLGFKLTFHNSDVKCSFQWEGSNQMTQVHPVILWWMSRNWNDVAPEVGITTLRCKTECRYQGPGDERLYRAHPNYQGNGERYDWAMVDFGEHGKFPSRLLLFYQKHDPVFDEATGNVTTSGMHAIVHTCEYRTETLEDRREKLHETRLCSRWVAESKPNLRSTSRGNGGRRTNVPVLRTVPVESLDEHVYVIDENPGLQEEWTGEKVVWSLHDQRTVWSTVFLSPDNAFN
jgi:hypothetical protein